MKKFRLFLMAAVALIGFSACSSSSDDNSEEPEEPGFVGVLKQLPAEMLGNWNKGYVTNEGLFLLKHNKAVVGAPRLKEAALEALNIETLFFESADGATKTTLLVNKESKLPIQLVMQDGVLNFSFVSDNVLELVFKKGTDINYVDKIEFDKEALDAALAAADYKNDLQTSLFYFAKITDIKKLSSYPTVVAAAKHFSSIVNSHFTGSSTMTASEVAEAGMTVADDGVAVAAKEAETFEDTYVEPVYNTITVWTGKASFKVGGSSCSLGGTLFCSDPRAVTVGSVGIVCDKDPNKLFVGQAEFQANAELKDGQNFNVDFRGFNPKTTYYYRAFYQFTEGEAHDGLILDPAQKYNESISYDKTTKQFTTGEYKYTVDVVMLMDISGSMSGELNMVKNNAKDFYELFKGKCDEKKINLTGLTAQVVTYSDINVDKEEALNKSDVFDLLTNHDDFNKYVDGISLSYGGDTPESGLEALATAFQREWGPDDGLHRQIFILWTDATYKTVNEGICKLPLYDFDNNLIEDNCERNADGSIKYDVSGNPVAKPMYTAFSLDQVKAMWDGMPSGRRLILIAPFGTYGNSNEGSWKEMDEWKNVYHEDINGYDYNFGKVLDYFIDEMIGKDKDTDETAKARKRFVKYPEPVNR